MMMTRQLSPDVKALLAGGVFLLFAVAAVHGGWAPGGAARAEARLQALAEESLRASGEDWAQVDVDGTLLILKGDAPSAEALEAAVAALESVARTPGSVMARGARLVKQAKSPLVAQRPEVAAAMLQRTQRPGQVRVQPLSQSTSAETGEEPPAQGTLQRTSPRQSPQSAASVASGSDPTATAETTTSPVASQVASEGTGPLSVSPQISSETVTDCQTLINTRKPPGAITFALNAFELDEAGQDITQAVARALNEPICAEMQLVITGHTDNRGDPEQNLPISQARAQAVYRAMVGAGVSASRLTWSGVGDAQPLMSNDTLAGRQANRRISMTVRPTAANAVDLP